MNLFSAFSGLNHLITQAKGKYAILCHDDCKLVYDDRDVLRMRLAELDQVDPTWALAGNAGVADSGKHILRISDPRGLDQSTGPFPHKVVSLDENFLVVKRSTAAGFSRDLESFHFYGADV